jgi:hypothetical protein
VRPPASYNAETSNPFPIAGSGADAGLSLSACVTPPGSIRVKVITTTSQDPNDQFADPLYNVHVTIGGTKFVIPDNDDIARGTVGPGSLIIKYPKDNGLDDPDTHEHLYRVGSINVHATKTDGSGDRCNPVDQEGDVPYTFDPAAYAPDSLSDYEVALRIVPFDAPALQNGVDCK